MNQINQAMQDATISAMVDHFKEGSWGGVQPGMIQPTRAMYDAAVAEYRKLEGADVDAIIEFESDMLKDFGIESVNIPAPAQDLHKELTGTPEGQTLADTPKGELPQNPPSAGSAEAKSGEFIPAPVTETVDKDAKAQGLADAEFFESTVKEGEAKVRGMILDRAKAYIGKPVAQASWLLGYAEGLKVKGYKDGSIRVLKSNAKSVLEAWDNPASGNKESAHSLLLEFKGHNSEFFDLARNIRGVTLRAPRSSNPGVGVSDVRRKKAMETVQEMSIGQAAEVVHSAVAVLHQAGDMALLRQVNVVCDLLAKSNDIGIAQFAKDTISRVIAILEADDKARRQREGSGKPTQSETATEALKEAADKAAATPVTPTPETGQQQSASATPPVQQENVDSDHEQHQQLAA